MPPHFNVYVSIGTYDKSMVLDISSLVSSTY